MMLGEERPRSELVFSVPKATLPCPSAAPHVGWESHGCRRPSSRDGGCSLTGNLISKFFRKECFLFQEEDFKHCSLDFPFQEKYEKIKTYIVFRKSSSFHCPWPSQVPALLPFTELCFSPSTLTETNETSLAGVTQLLHQALTAEVKQNVDSRSAEVPATFFKKVALK